VSLRIPSSSQSADHGPHRTIYYLGYPLGRFAGLKHRQLARQVGVIITTKRIRRTTSQINLLIDIQPFGGCIEIQYHKSNMYLTDYCSMTSISIPCSKMHRNPKLISWHRSPKQQIRILIKTTTSRIVLVLEFETGPHGILALCYVHTDRYLEDYKIIVWCTQPMYTTTTTSTMRASLPCCPAAWLYINYVVHREYSSIGYSSSTSAMPCTATTHRPDYQLYYAYAMHPDALSQRSTSRQSVALALAVCPVIPLCVMTTRLTAATDILRLRRASRCLCSLRSSSSTTSPTPRVRVPQHVARHVARLVVENFTYATRLGASARRAARRRLLRVAPLVVDFFA
jgi:hypothetical protein